MISDAREQIIKSYIADQIQRALRYLDDYEFNAEPLRAAIEPWMAEPSRSVADLQAVRDDLHRMIAAAKSITRGRHALERLEKKHVQLGGTLILPAPVQEVATN